MRLDLIGWWMLALAIAALAWMFIGTGAVRLAGWIGGML